MGWGESNASKVDGGSSATMPENAKDVWEYS